MTKEDIIRMARGAYGEWYPNAVPHELEVFANLVAAAEREAILQTIDELDDDRHPMFAEGYRHALQHIREFIEGREEA